MILHRDKNSTLYTIKNQFKGNLLWFILPSPPLTTNFTPKTGQHHIKDDIKKSPLAPTGSLWEEGI